MKYYAIINDTQTGPMELPELVEAGLTPDTYVWCKGMSDWQQASEVADICRFFRNRIFDLMHPTAENTGGADGNAHKEFRLMDDSDYKGMKRREFYANVGEQIARTAKDPEEEKIEQGIPPNPLPVWLSVLAILLLFPLGIPALLLSRKSRKLWAAGMEREAHETARTARMWAGMAVCIGIVGWSLLIQYLLGK